MRIASRHEPDEYTAGDRDPRADIFRADRPWGHFQQFVSNETVTVKIISVEPGHRLSLQRHGYRGEMWQVLDEPMDVEVGDRHWVAQPGETVWVPHGSMHRLGNTGSRAGRILEVAFGSFDESDIERIEDDYQRQDDPQPTLSGGESLVAGDQRGQDGLGR